MLSASSWGCELKCDCWKKTGKKESQPPREAVSWNIISFNLSLAHAVSLLVRLWVEIPLTSTGYVRRLVSLLVRLWVEIGMDAITLLSYVVSLLVRLWVEISAAWTAKKRLTSASSWGCELKWIMSWQHLHQFHVSLLVRLWVEIIFDHIFAECMRCQPPREAVSWNN